MIRIMSVAALCAGLCGCVQPPPQSDQLAQQYLTECAQSSGMGLLTVATLGTSMVAAIPYCMDKAKKEAAADRQKAAQEAAAQAAAAEAQKQIVIHQMGGIQKYNAYVRKQQEQQNEEAQAANFSAQMNFCLNRLPVPATQYQDQWERSHCYAYAQQIVGSN